MYGYEPSANVTKMLEKMKKSELIELLLSYAEENNLIASNLESMAIRTVKSNSIDLNPVLSRIRDNLRKDYTDDIAYDIINSLKSLSEAGFHEKALSFGKDIFLWITHAYNSTTEDVLCEADSLGSTISEILNQANMTIEEKESYRNNLKKYDEFDFLSM